MRRRAVLGWIGVLLACSLWIASAGALARAMARNAQTSSLLRAYPSRAEASSADLSMVLWCIAFTLLQLTSFLLFAFVFRASWQLRSALCFLLAAGLVMVGDTAGLFALLVWLGVTLGAG